MKNKAKVIIVCIILFILFLVIFTNLKGPIVFAKDGLVTCMKTESFEHQFDLGATLRHDDDTKKIYILYLGFNPIHIKCDRSLQDIPTRNIIPFLNTFTLDEDECAYRVTIGNNKYYVTIVSV